MEDIAITLDEAADAAGQPRRVIDSELAEHCPATWAGYQRRLAPSTETEVEEEYALGLTIGQFMANWNDLAEPAMVLDVSQIDLEPVQEEGGRRSNFAITLSAGVDLSCNVISSSGEMSTATLTIDMGDGIPAGAAEAVRLMVRAVAPELSDGDGVGVMNDMVLSMQTGQATGSTVRADVRFVTGGIPGVFMIITATSALRPWSPESG